ncbi:addiction module antidote protein [Pseudomonas aeruginosa]|nr:addiction module antidote protein [Pseudomonas aeruginosa]HBO1759578.1 hypothetical protein [Pseudomonas aeruginosa]HCE9372119.1 hypothetical protein [Pseudomonas aeruginosa]
MAEIFRADPSYAQELMDDLRLDGRPDELAILFRQIALGAALDLELGDAG